VTIFSWHFWALFSGEVKETFWAFYANRVYVKTPKTFVTNISISTGMESETALGQL
jgi:hypothetical protein